jgi:hypothetical protein
MELTSTTVWMPVYKKELSLCELASLYQTNLALGFLPRTIAGKSRHRKFLIRLGMELNNASSMSYPNSVFASVSSYCNLLLSPAFYRQFTTTHMNSRFTTLLRLLFTHIHWHIRWKTRAVLEWGLGGFPSAGVRRSQMHLAIGVA